MFKQISEKLLLIALLVFSCTMISQAQINADSIRLVWENNDNKDSLRFKAINKYYKSQTYAEPDSVLLLTDDHYDFAEINNSKYEMSRALNERSYAYYLKGNTKKAMVSLKQSIALLEQLDDPIGLARVYSNVGNIYGEENKYQESVRYFYKTLKVFKDVNLKEGEARILNNIGLIYYYIDSYDLALDHFTESIDIYHELKLVKKIGSGLSHIGSVYYGQGKYIEAIEKGEEAIQLLLESNNKFTLADNYFLLAKAYEKIGNKEKTRYYLDKSLEIDYTINNNSRIIERLTFDADSFYDSDLTKATEKAEDVLKLVKGDTRNELKVGLYELLYKCYKSQNKYDLSLSMHEKRVIYNDSLQLQKNKTVIVREAIQNEYEAKLYQTQLDNEKTQGKLKVDHLNRTYAIIFICTLLVFFIGFYSRSVIKANQKEKDGFLEELERLKSIDSSLVAQTNKFELDRFKIEAFIERKINETDWKVLNILIDDPVMPNKDIAKKAFMSVDGIGSSLRRMYDYFEIKESKYKKISLLMLAIKLSNN